MKIHGGGGRRTWQLPEKRGDRLFQVTVRASLTVIDFYSLIH
jgi:hypothetical protein